MYEYKDKEFPTGLEEECNEAISNATYDSKKKPCPHVPALERTLKLLNSIVGNKDLKEQDEIRELVKQVRDALGYKF